MKLCSVLGGLKGGLLVLQPLFVDIKWLKHSSHGYHGATVFLLLLLWHQPGINFIELRLVPEFPFLTCLHLWLLYIIFTSLNMHILIGKITLKSHSAWDKFVQMPKQQKKPMERQRNMMENLQNGADDIIKIQRRLLCPAQYCSAPLAADRACESVNGTNDRYE